MVVDVTSPEAFDNSNGPQRFTDYTLVLTGISIGCCLVFTQFLPTCKAQCHEWQAIGDKKGNSAIRGIVTLTMCLVTVLVGALPPHDNSPIPVPIHRT